MLLRPPRALACLQFYGLPRSKWPIKAPRLGVIKTRSAGFLGRFWISLTRQAVKTSDK